MPDVVCFEDLDEFGRDLDDPVEELYQDIVHMLFESFGTNADAPDRSIGLEDALSAPTDPSLRHRIELKLTDDPRIDAAEATLVSVDDTHTRIDLKIQANATELGVALIFDGAGNLQRAEPA